jgi:DNA invertase Pin-like site-specific DNA recombinase
MKKAFAYVRVSGRSQGSGDGPQRQRHAVREYAKQNGIKIERVFQDEVSGTKNAVDRPEFMNMMQALYANGTKLVLVEKLDRLARDLMVQEAILADLRKNDFTVVSVLEPDLLQDDPTRKLMRQIVGAVAEYEKSMLVLKLSAAKVRLRAKGRRCDGRLPFGKKAGEERIVERMRVLHGEGIGIATIAATLDEEGLHPRMGGDWNPLVVGRLIRRGIAGAPEAGGAISV